MLRTTASPDQRTGEQGTHITHEEQRKKSYTQNMRKREKHANNRKHDSPD